MLYFQRGRFIVRLDLDNPTRPERVVRLPRTTGVSGVVVRGAWVYWATFDRNGAIMRASLGGKHVQQLVGRLKYAGALVADDRFLYWLDENAVGRVAFDGSQTNRGFLRPPREANGGVGDGLATDGRYLYVASCDRSRIGRVASDGSAKNWSLIVLGRHSCPQDLAIGARYLYWTELGYKGGTIGRARLDGSQFDDRWYRLHVIDGPLSLAVGGGAVYWTWGGAARTTPYVGRVALDRSHAGAALRRRGERAGSCEVFGQLLPERLARDRLACVGGPRRSRGSRAASPPANHVRLRT
jgi:hypothetical protein